MPRRRHYGAVAISMADPSWLNRYDNNEHIRIDSDRQPNSQGAGLRRQCDSKSQRTDLDVFAGNGRRASGGSGACRYRLTEDLHGEQDITHSHDDGRERNEDDQGASKHIEMIRPSGFPAYNCRKLR
jgi:hypothetical protein